MAISVFLFLLITFKGIFEGLFIESLDNEITTINLYTNKLFQCILVNDLENNN